MALAALERTPFPNDVTGKDPDELLALYRTVEGMKSPQRPKTRELIEFSSYSIGITEGKRMAQHEIAALLNRYRQLEKELDELTLKLTGFIQKTSEYEYLSTIPSLGDPTIIDLLSEIDSFSYYKDPRQLIKLAGLALRENSSGMHKGQKRISKRGRRKLRALLLRVMMPIIRHNETFKKLHKYYTTRTQNPLRKK